jgi:outer membrane protein assembly factor BamB
LIALGMTSAARAHLEADGGLAASNWPMFQHDTRHTGRSELTGIMTRPLTAWTIQLPGPYAGEIADGISQANDGTIYVSAMGRLSAIDPESGNIYWTFTGQNNSRSTPAVGADGTVYWGYEDNFVALSPDGMPVWSWSGLSGNLVFGSSPVVAADGTVYVTHDGLFSFSAEGDVNWALPFGNWTHSSPAIGPDSNIYVGSNTGYLYAFSPEGDLEWLRFVASNDNPPSIADDGTIYIGTSTGRVYAYQPDGTLRWTFVTEEAQYDNASVQAAPAIGSDGSLYFGTHVTGGASEYAAIYGVTAEGQLKWRIPVHRGHVFNPGVTGGIVVDQNDNLFACAENGLCYGITPEGVVFWTARLDPIGGLHSAPLITADNRMIILTGRATLVALFPSTHSVYLPSIAIPSAP